MTVTSAQVSEVTGTKSNTEVMRLREIVGVQDRVGSGNRYVYDEFTADLMVTVWFAQSAWIRAFGPKGGNWALLRTLVDQLRADPNHVARWSTYPIAVEMHLVRTDWSTVRPTAREREEISR
jgi:hypothetical protein